MPSMLSTPLRPLRHSSRKARSSRTSLPRGSTLVVVLALLALLSILGLAFVTFASSERISAENYSGAAEREFQSRPRPSTRILTRFAADRLFSGSRANERNSALSGGRHTLIAGIVGRDVQPHSGHGVNVIGYTSDLKLGSGQTARIQLQSATAPDDCDRREYTLNVIHKGRLFHSMGMPCVDMLKDIETIINSFSLSR